MMEKMKIKYFAIAAGLVSAFFMGCKTDSEDDIPGWNDEEKPTGTVVLNEICGKQDPDDDWVELFNPSTSEVDLANARIVKTDENGEEKTIYTFAQGKKIKPGEYIVVATLTGELQAGISNSKEVGLRLEASNGTVLDRFDRDSDVGKDKGHDEGGSYARLPNGNGKWAVAEKATRGSENTGEGGQEKPADDGKTVINEVCGKQDPDDDWVEIYNNSSEEKDLSGAKLMKTDEDGVTEEIYAFPANTKIGGKSYLVVSTLSGQLQAGISNKKEVALELVGQDGKSIDRFDRDKDVGTDVSHDAGGSFARIPNGTGKWSVVASATRGDENK